jgi:hypothetical protein
VQFLGDEKRFYTAWVELVREIPKTMKPRRIAIGGGAPAAQITKKAA